jgi:hypothetical protein
MECGDDDGSGLKMSYVLQIVVGQLVADDDHQYEQLPVARPTEAVKAARDVMREWLPQGKRIPPRACIGILDEIGYLADTVLFKTQHLPVDIHYIGAAMAAGDEYRAKAFEPLSSRAARTIPS